MIKETGFDPTGCQEAMGSHNIGYGHGDRKLKKGDRQSFCETCERWRWIDQRCKEFWSGTG